jgi:hypothetical protein
VADKTTLLLLSALRRALAEPGGMPLHGGKASPGLFSSTSSGKQLAQRCLEEGLIQPLETDARLHVLSEKGLDWLMSQASPRTVLEDFVRALEARQAESAALLNAARQIQTTLEGLHGRVDRVLQQLPAGQIAPTSSDVGPKENILEFLTRWQSSRGVSEDCPLPELYRQAAGSLSIGGFHDGLRQLHDSGQLYLHPWTGPLYALPEPSFALLVGHEIAYYASPRRPLAA